MEKERIREACEEFLELWDRHEWMADHGEWASEDDDTIGSESDYIAEGVIDPDNVADSAVYLGVDKTWQGWDCREGWAAYRSGDALYLNWWRSPTTNLRHDRDLWVLVDKRFFEEEEVVS